MSRSGRTCVSETPITGRLIFSLPSAAPPGSDQCVAKGLPRLYLQRETSRYPRSTAKSITAFFTCQK
jgi:hypothetical protein